MKIISGNLIIEDWTYLDKYDNTNYPRTYEWHRIITDNK